jgi:hypothetical protein
MEFINVFDYKDVNILMMGIVILFCMAPCLLIQLIKEYSGFDRKDAIVFKKTDYIIGIILVIALIYLIINCVNWFMTKYYD